MRRPPGGDGLTGLADAAPRAHLTARGSDDADRSEIAAAPSQAQRDFWVLQRLAADPATYNLCCTVVVVGTLSVARLQGAVDAAVRSESQLRASFVEGSAGEPVVLVADPDAVRVRVWESDCLGLTPERVLKEIRVQASHAFDLSAAPLLRLGVARLGPDRALVSVVTHHLTLDGNGAQQLLVNLIRTALGTPTDRRDAPSGYLEHVAAEARRAAVRGPNDRRFWASALAAAAGAGDPGVPATGGPSGRSASMSLDIPVSAPLRAAIERTARDQRVSPFMLLLGAVGRVAARHRTRPMSHLVCGVPVDRRGESTAAGTYTVTLPAVLPLDTVDDRAELLARVRTATLDLLAHPYITLREVMGLTARSSAAEFEEAVLPWSLILNWVVSPGQLEFGTHRIEAPRSLSTGTKSALAVTIYDHGFDAMGTITYSPARYGEAQVRAWWQLVLAEMSRLCDLASAEPDRDDLATYLDNVLELWDTVWDSPRDGINLISRQDSARFSEQQVLDYRSRIVSLVTRHLSGGGRVLEIGCGDGQLTRLLAPMTTHLVSVDPSAVAVRRVRAAVADDNQHVEVVEAFAHDIGSRVSATFDLVLVAGVIQFFPDADYLRQVLAQASAMLADRGCVVLADVVELESTQFTGAFKLPRVELAELCGQYFDEVVEDGEAVIGDGVRYDLVMRRTRGAHARTSTATQRIDSTVEPTDSVESRLRSLVGEVLGCEVDEIDSARSFFVEGGDSVSAVRLLGLIRGEFGRRVRLIDFFEDPTVDFLVATLDGRR